MKTQWLLLFIVLTISLQQPPCNAAVDLEILQDIDIGAEPLDVAVSDNGLWI